MMGTKIKVLQVNCHRRRVTHDLLEEISTRRHIDVLLLSEPNKTLAGRKKDEWITDAEADTCIIDRSGRGLRHGSGQGFTWIEIPNIGRLYSCYSSPNDPTHELNQLLDNVIDTSPNATQQIITGDFNAASPSWGSPNFDSRGTTITDWMATHDLTTINDGAIPTFQSSRGNSFVDLTICKSNFSPKIENWQVLENEVNLSDHLCIEFYINPTIPSPPQPPRRARPLYQGNAATYTALKNHIEQHGPPDDVQELQALLETACLTARIHPNRKRQVRPQYWWNEEIARARQECLRCRRRLKRLKAKGECTIEAGIELKTCRQTLATEIRKSKTERWKDFLKEIADYPWGEPYQVIRREWKKACKPVTLPHDLKRDTIQKLFPAHAEFDRSAFETVPPAEEIPDVTEAEVVAAGVRLKEGRAPGPDGIPPAATKLLFRAFPEVVAPVATKMMKEGIFPEMLKTGAVILLPKGNGSYRPICLLGTLAKGFEAIIEHRLRQHAEEFGLMSDSQYGFRSNRSVLTAIHRVVSKAESIRKQPRKSRELCLTILLDVKNAFNSLPWSTILATLQKRRVPPYLTRIISQYLHNRVLKCDELTFGMTAGVPQGSILGPLLWNITYDGVLRIEDLPAGVDLIAYADDLAVTIQAGTPEELEEVTNYTLQEINIWMQRHRLELAPSKSEAILLTGRKKCPDLTIRLAGERIQLVDTARYLGVHLDKAMTGTAHVKIASAKAMKTAGATAGLTY